MQTTEAGTLYAGADLHGNNVFLSLIDGGGKEVYRRRVKANLAAVDEALDLMGHDKKVQQGKIRLVLLRAIGDAFVTADFQLSDLTAVLQTNEINHADS